MTPDPRTEPTGRSAEHPSGSPEAPSAESKSFGADGSSPAGSGRDRALDYGHGTASTANREDGVDDLTAGAAAADALPPDAVAESADIAADDVGASAFAEAAGRERTGRLNDDGSNPTTEGSGAMPSGGQGAEVDPGAG